MKNENEMYLDPKPPGWRLLTNAEADALRAELAEVMKELKAADQGDEVFLTPAARMRLEARRDDLKRQLADAEKRPVGPSATTENERAEPMAFNEEALGRALSKASPAERKEFSAEVRRLGEAIDELSRNAEAVVATATATNAGGADDARFADPVPYHE